MSFEFDINPEIMLVAIQFNKEECANVNETAPDFVGCSPGGLSSVLQSMSLTFSQAGSASTASVSTASSTASSGSVNPSISTLTGDAISETAAISTSKPVTITSFAGAPLMTGSCTVPHFAIVTDAMGKVTEFPEIGCSPDRPDCCPFPDGLNAYITRCPQDYFTTASACCPLGYQIYYTNIGLTTPCYSIPATSYVPATTPTIAGLTLVTDHVFSQKYMLVPQKANYSGLPFGGKIAIPASIWAVIIVLIGVAIWYVRRKRRLRREAEANRATTFPAEEPAMHQISTSRAATMHELDSPEPQATSPSRVSAGWPIIAPQSPPAYDPQTTAPTPAITKQPPAPLELPGSTYIHEHHPAYSNAGSSVGTPTETTPGSPPGTPSEQKSPVLSAVTPRSETHSPMFVSPLASPDFRKTG
ncbi:hypothetical protein H2200_010266 [Cladophialophora chaetospira]|uniref:Uncharacterized protein n=1 Tax=Cladophialophora chaetospira TaxID=386627 RepID=A0AA38X2H0_9EURO|nr:hypothetical protein H2200_010266 [Cladophialophora chaetospira]